MRTSLVTGRREAGQVWRVRSRISQRCLPRGVRLLSLAAFFGHPEKEGQEKSARLSGRRLLAGLPSIFLKRRRCTAPPQQRRASLASSSLIPSVEEPCGSVRPEIADSIDSSSEKWDSASSVKSLQDEAAESQVFEGPTLSRLLRSPCGGRSSKPPRPSGSFTDGESVGTEAVHSPSQTAPLPLSPRRPNSLCIKSIPSPQMAVSQSSSVGRATRDAVYRQLPSDSSRLALPASSQHFSEEADECSEGNTRDQGSECESSGVEITLRSCSCHCPSCNDSLSNDGEDSLEDLGSSPREESDLTDDSLSFESTVQQEEEDDGEDQGRACFASEKSAEVSSDTSQLSPQGAASSSGSVVANAVASQSLLSAPPPCLEASEEDWAWTSAAGVTARLFVSQTGEKSESAEFSSPQTQRQSPNLSFPAPQVLSASDSQNPEFGENKQPSEQKSLPLQSYTSDDSQLDGSPTKTKVQKQTANSTDVDLPEKTPPLSPSSQNLSPSTNSFKTPSLLSPSPLLSSTETFSPKPEVATVADSKEAPAEKGSGVSTSEEVSASSLGGGAFKRSDSTFAVEVLDEASLFPVAPVPSPSKRSQTFPASRLSSVSSESTFHSLEVSAWPMRRIPQNAELPPRESAIQTHGSNLGVSFWERQKLTPSLVETNPSTTTFRPPAQERLSVSVAIGTLPSACLRGNIQRNIQEYTQGNVLGSQQGNLQGNLQGDMHGSLHENLQGNQPAYTQGNMQGIQQGNMHASLGENLQGNLQGNMLGSQQGNLQENLQGNMLGSQQGNLQENQQGNMHGILQGNIYRGNQPAYTQGNMQGNQQGNMHASLGGNLQGNQHVNMLGSLHGNLRENQRGNMIGILQGNLQGNMHASLQGNLQGNQRVNMLGILQGNLQGNQPAYVQGNMQGNQQGNMLGSLHGKLQGNQQGNMQGNRQGNMHGSLQRNLQGNLQGSPQQRALDVLLRQRPLQHNFQTGGLSGLLPPRPAAPQLSVHCNGKTGDISALGEEGILASESVHPRPLHFVSVSQRPTRSLSETVIASNGARKQATGCTDTSTGAQPPPTFFSGENRAALTPRCFPLSAQFSVHEAAALAQQKSRSGASFSTSWFLFPSHAQSMTPPVASSLKAALAPKLVPPLPLCEMQVAALPTKEHPQSARETLLRERRNAAFSSATPTDLRGAVPTPRRSPSFTAHIRCFKEDMRRRSEALLVSVESSKELVERQTESQPVASASEQSTTAVAASGVSPEQTAASEVQKYKEEEASLDGSGHSTTCNSSFRPSTPARARTLRESLERAAQRGELSAANFPAAQVHELVEGFRVSEDGGFPVYELEHGFALGCNDTDPNWPLEMLRNRREAKEMVAEINKLLQLARSVGQVSPGSPSRESEAVKREALEEEESYKASSTKEPFAESRN